MKRILTSFLAVVLVLVVMLGFSAVAEASPTITIYDQDQSGWETAVGGSYITEDFTDATLNPGLTVDTTYPGYVDTSRGVWWDRLVYDPPKTTTTWQFENPIYAFGGTWNPGGPGGPGSNIEVLINGSWVSVGVINSSYINKSWGFVSDVPFTEVRLQAYSAEGWCETYELDNLVYSSERWIDTPGKIVGWGGYNNTILFQSPLSSDLPPFPSLGTNVFFNFNILSNGFYPVGTFYFSDRALFNLWSNQITGLMVSPDKKKAVFKGNVKIGVRWYKFVVNVDDNGNPGMNDKFKLNIYYLNTRIYASEGSLSTGNIQIYP